MKKINGEIFKITYTDEPYCGELNEQVIIAEDVYKAIEFWQNNYDVLPYPKYLTKIEMIGGFGSDVDPKCIVTKEEYEG